MNNINHGRRLLSKILALISLCTYYANASTQQFEQAFAPVSANDIVFFVPIELKPSPSLILNGSFNQSDLTLAWSEVKDADYYQVEEYTNGIWKALNTNLANNSLHLKGPLKSENYRVRSCHRYGCSDWKTLVSYVDSKPKLRYFYANKYLVTYGESVTINWQFINAHDLKLYVNGLLYAENLHSSGRKSINVNGLTNVEILATGVAGSKREKITVAARNDVNHSKVVGVSGYVQPLYGVNRPNGEPIWIINRSIKTTAQGDIYAATPDNSIVKVDQNSTFRWEYKTNGIVANKPLLHSGNLYFGVSKLDGKGEVCIKKDDIQNYSAHCVTTESEVISSPFLFKGNIFALTNSGKVHQLDFTNTPRIKGSFSIQHTNSPTLIKNSNSEVVIGKNKLGEEYLIVKYESSDGKHRVVSIEIDDSIPRNTISFSTFNTFGVVEQSKVKMTWSEGL
ncbi:hypothetical protein [Pseudoalteromonas luteoviolacea]|uniref:hypothetical protein n=1 Tax=Pseudoalteromonas luteoviolacea TaxID=43657 RepID=UPI000AF351D9|nr:hypothetical protein [Pseudoalteromonas luteoviolacea]